MNIEMFFGILECFAGVVLLFVSAWSYLSLRLRSFKRVFEIIIVASILIIHGGIFSITGVSLISNLCESIALFLLSIAFALLITAAKTIGIGR